MADLTPDALLLAGMILVAAALYSSVGHGGASAYLAAMALVGTSHEVMKPTALTLNILVAGIATFRFWRAGRFCLRTFLVFTVASAPMALVGGYVSLPGTWYRKIVGLALLFAAWRLAFAGRGGETSEKRLVPLESALAIGAALGLLSGLTGVGGGIYLTPILILMRWSEPREAAGISAAFILVNSIAGFCGLLARLPALPTALPLWAIMACVGGLVGSTLGSRYFAGSTVRRVLAVVLLIAGSKLLWVA